LASAREYELVLMLDPGRDAPARDTLAEEAKGMIAGGGTLKHENNWGLRKMAYEIERRTEADYRWFRFEAPSEVLEKLDHNLKIADGVLRFRIFKVDPEAPVMVPPAVAAPAPGRDRDRDRDQRSSAPAPAPTTPVEPEPAAAAAAPAVEEAPAEAAPAEDAAAAAEEAPATEEPAAEETEATPAEAPSSAAVAESDEPASE
jgi:small subunit ribosomal protein S6